LPKNFQAGRFSRPESPHGLVSPVAKVHPRRLAKKNEPIVAVPIAGAQPRCAIVHPVRRVDKTVTNSTSRFAVDTNYLTILIKILWIPRS